MIIIFLILSFITISAVAQKETNIWYFGNQAGLDFSSGSPVAITNSAMVGQEGCAVACDKITGGLLFYTDGITVYNKNHLAMPNGTGLHGNGNSTQSALIVPFPNSNSLYYIFTISDFQTNQGFKYSVVDMSLNGGLGDVTVKNTMLLASASEKLAGVYANCKDVWVLVHQSGTSAYYSYLVTAAGISAPVITNIGPAFPNPVSPGHLKFSPNGSMVAVAGYVQMSQVHLLDFNRTTGVLSNYRLIDSSIPGYGVSFSPDNTKLYIGYMSTADIYQYNIALSTAAAIAGSKTFIGNAGAWLCAFELGPDGKLYIAKNGPNIDVINSPNQSGAACNYVVNGINLAGKISANGLPNYIESYFDTSFIAGSGNLTISASPSSTICSGSSVTLTASGGTNYLWSNGQTTTSITVTLTATTTYTVITGIGSCPDTAFATIAIGNITATATNSTICSGNSATLTASGGTNYSWSNGQTTSFITVAPAATTTYSVIVFSGTCSDTAFATVTVNSGLIVSAGSNVTVCAGTNTTLSASGGSSYSWSNGQTNSSITVNPTTTTTYTVIGMDANGCTGNNSVTVVTTPSIVANAGPDGTICAGNNFQLNASGGTGYTWIPSTGLSNFNSPNPFASPSIITNYTVIVTSGNCPPASDIVTVVVNPNPVANAGSNITITSAGSAMLNASGGVIYNWSPVAGLNNPNISNPIANPFVTTEYCVTVTDSYGCTDISCVKVYVESSCLIIPNAFSPNYDGENDEFCLQGDSNCIKELKVIIYNRWGEKVFSAKGGESFCWDGTYNGNMMNTAVYVYYMEATFFSGEEIAKTGNISLLK